MVNTANPAATAAIYFAMMHAITPFVTVIFLACLLVACLAFLSAVAEKTKKRSSMMAVYVALFFFRLG
ncbi:hypothetical protein MOTE_20160 [Moorella thermoacetica]|uniref:Uncharacterized protein n=1 Tax=Neomoorella thermoacetica TaxID=1525 RepID=A0A1J5NH37_NEOTH|nr:hypothetical protein MOTE_20160 [Moorella thermoacetica]